MANTPRTNDRLEFMIKIFPGGRFSSLLEGGFTVGQELEVVGPYGVFMLREKSNTKLSASVEVLGWHRSGRC